MKQLLINNLYQLTLDQINEEERGALNIARFNRWANLACRDFVDYFTGRLHEEPTPGLGMLKTQKIGDLCFPIFKRVILPYANGLVPYPENYDHLLDLRLSASRDWQPTDCDTLPKYTIDQILNGQAGFRQIEVLSHDETAARTDTHIPLLKEKPVAEQYADGYLIYNSAMAGSVFYAYIATFPDVVLNMVMDLNLNMPVYSETGSVHPPFHEKAGRFLAKKIAQYHFHWTRESGAIESAEVVDKTG